MNKVKDIIYNFEMMREYMTVPTRRTEYDRDELAVSAVQSYFSILGRQSECLIGSHKAHLDAVNKAVDLIMATIPVIAGRNPRTRVAKSVYELFTLLAKYVQNPGEAIDMSAPTTENEIDDFISLIPYEYYRYRVSIVDRVILGKPRLMLVFTETSYN